MTPQSPLHRPFFKILVANRGEIALRIMRTARRLGYGVVAVYSDADRGARHVREADAALRIGEAAPAGSYLDIDAIISAARAGGADALHPGYGFLAESAGLAEACRDAGIVFIGPSPEAIRAMGNKAVAKEIMRKAGVPTVPGYLGDDQGEAALLREARALGFPLMIKAVGGGGGRGMRRVACEAAFAPALRSARFEAGQAFGDATVMLERAIASPRHIEIQVFGDSVGNAIHLYERDCSIQRRHQKLIEEAPSPAVSQELRQAMGAVAVAAVKALRYEGAGTVEFLLDPKGGFYFLEMNTRLQVEHPVTEAITGLDLVELQLRVARGEPLALRQEDVKLSGHAIEARLCAEDAGHDFMPQSGRMLRWQAPPSVRSEHALESGSDIPSFYDSMIAKLVSHGATREDARSLLICALEQLVAFGVITNQAFLLACLRHPSFGHGQATTDFVERHRTELLAQTEVSLHAALAAMLLSAAGPSARSFKSGRALPAPFPRPLRFQMEGRVHELEAVRERDGFYVISGPAVHRFEIDELGSEAIRFRHDGIMESARFFRDRDRLYFLHRGVTRAVRDLTLAPPQAASVSEGDGRVRATMNGRVVAILVKQGDRVAPGQPVITLEAMKMEHVHTAGVAGTVGAIAVVTGEQVAAGQVVAEIEAAS